MPIRARSTRARDTSQLHLAAMTTFDTYYRQDYRQLIGLAYVLTGSMWAAEDLAQDALTEAHRSWNKISAYDDPGAWVRKVLVNKSTSRFRRLRTEARGVARLGARRTTVVEPTEHTHEVWDAVRALPGRQAQVVALFYWEDRPLEDIARILGISTETVKTHLARGRASLAAKLNDHREPLS